MPDLLTKEQVQSIAELFRESFHPIPALCRTLLATMEKRDALKRAVEDAPHEFDCESHFIQSQCIGHGKCDCWKSRITQAVQG